jgi:type VI secretion system protein ImpH
MARQDRMSPDDLRFLQMLEEVPYQADFNAVLRAVECMYSSQPRLGQSLRPADDPIRMGQAVTLAFPPSSLESFQQGQNGRPDRLLVNLLGLLGPNGPMPLHITEYIYERARHFNDKTLAAFLDLFHHRLLSLFYRAWADGEPTVSLDRPETDQFGHFLAALIGLGLKSLRDRDAMPDWTKFHFSGALSCQTRHADGLKSILSRFFEAPITVEEFVGRWISLPRQCLCQLGTSRSTASLGSNATIGYRVWDYQQTFRIVFGPVGFEVYQRMLPGREGLKRLTAIVRNYVGDELAWELQLILKQDEVPRVQLGHQGRLGWTSWLRARPPTKHADDLVLSPGSA